MVRFGGAAVFLIALIGPVGLAATIPPATAGELTFALGLKEQFFSLRRTLKIEKTDGSETRRIETPVSDGNWMTAVALNASYDHWFVGAEAAAVSLTISEQPSSFSDPLFLQKSKVDLTEVNLAVGYTVMRGVSPYVGYLRHGQTTDLRCTGCTTTVELGRVGPGILLDHPMADTRWAGYLNLALIQGFSIEGGLSYAGIRWPLVGVAGFAYRRIDYPANQVSCGQTGFLCFREKDVFSGPILAVNYIF
ncbi:MAG: hypothetical protein HY283_05160 [Nitrospirae bacterium]|nr:hypothetical protein [Nitrospirota bacterium]